MTSFLRHGAARWVMPIAAAAVLSACATSAPVSPEAAVSQRANARWATLLAGNFDKAYTYLSPGIRAVTPLEEYKRRFGGGIQWESAQATSTECQPDRCEVKVQVRFRPPLAAQRMGVLTTYVDEVWIREQGQWWIFQNMK